MLLPRLDEFREIHLVDFEFNQRDGERPRPICMVSHEMRTGATTRWWMDQLQNSPSSPIPVRDDVLVVAYYSSAEWGCYRALGWPMPGRILDLYVEFRNLNSGLTPPCGESLLGALAYHGLPAIDAADKEEMRAMAMRGAPFTQVERDALLDYCESDVDSLAKLLPVMLPKISVAHALLRGRFMAAASAIESTGTPIDGPLLNKIRTHWETLKTRLIERVNPQFDVYDGQQFKMERFARYLFEHQIPWPRLESGSLNLSDDTFRDMAKAYPQIAMLRELRHTLSQLRLADLAVGSDGRNRCLLSAFRASTGRNAPSNTKFIFGPSVWLRGLIKPEAGRALAYIDYEQQEFGIAAALSKDPAMIEAYLTGDPYLAFAKQARALPPDATKKSHPRERDRFKACVLAVQYMMGDKSLAARLGIATAEAAHLLSLHRQTYPVFWRWSQAALDQAFLTGSLWTVFGWHVHVGSNANPRSLANFPMQAHGAEILRLACCTLVENGITVCAPVHDAVLVEGPIDEIDVIVNRTQAIMAEASSIVLGGFSLRTEAKVIRHPDRYQDPRGVEMWKTVMGILVELD